MLNPPICFPEVANQRQAHGERSACLFKHRIVSAVPNTPSRSDRSRLSQAQGGADFQLQGKKIWPRAEIGYKVRHSGKHNPPASTISKPMLLEGSLTRLGYQISDRYGSLVLSESKAVIRKDFKAEVGAVSMKVRCEAGCNLRGKVRKSKYTTHAFCCHFSSLARVCFCCSSLFALNLRLMADSHCSPGLTSMIPSH